LREIADWIHNQSHNHAKSFASGDPVVRQHIAWLDAAEALVRDADRRLLDSALPTVNHTSKFVWTEVRGKEPESRQAGVKAKAEKGE
jgi:hypothetical protein